MPPGSCTRTWWADRRETLRRFRLQAITLKLISLGEQAAVAEKWGLAGSGPRFWRLKDRIDRKFMAKFEDYPAMAALVVPVQATEGLAAHLAGRPLCGGQGEAGAGGKGRAGAVGRACAGFGPEGALGPGDDAAVLALGAGIQVLTTDHLRAFCNDPRLMARLAAIHALGDVWARRRAVQVALAQGGRCSGPRCRRGCCPR